MKKLLLITSRVPYPPNGGDTLKSYNTLKILSKYYDVFLVSISNYDIDQETIAELKKYTKSFKVFKKSVIDFCFSSLKTFVNNKPLQVNYYYFKDVQRYVDQLMEFNQFDILYSVLIRTTEYFYSYNNNNNLAVDICDSIGINYKRSIKNVCSIFWRYIYLFESTRLIRYEKLINQRFNINFFVNPMEMNLFNGRTCLLQNGVDFKKFDGLTYDSSFKNSIAFFGNMRVQHNIDAVIWFIENVFKKLDSNVEFMIIGVNPPKKILKYQQKYKNIKVTGFIDNPYQMLKSCRCIVAPLQTGAGIQNKILEAMGLGTINIISSLAALPINGVNGEHYLVCDSPIEMINIIKDIFMNYDKYNFLKKNSKKFIMDNFTWNKYEGILIEALSKIEHLSE